MVRAPLQETYAPRHQEVAPAQPPMFARQALLRQAIKPSQEPLLTCFTAAQTLVTIGLNSLGLVPRAPCQVLDRSSRQASQPRRLAALSLRTVPSRCPTCPPPLSRLLLSDQSSQSGHDQMPCKRGSSRATSTWIKSSLDNGL